MSSLQLVEAGRLSFESADVYPDQAAVVQQEKEHLMNLNSIDRKGRVFLADLMGSLALRCNGFVIEADDIKDVATAAASSYVNWCDMVVSARRSELSECGIDPDSYASQGCSLVSQVIKGFVLAHVPILPTAQEIEAHCWRYVGGYIEGCKALSPISGHQAAS